MEPLPQCDRSDPAAISASDVSSSLPSESLDCLSHEMTISIVLAGLVRYSSGHARGARRFALVIRPKNISLPLTWPSATELQGMVSPR
jgi:hypothetical protein